MVQSEKSKEKEILVRGKVNGEPMHSSSASGSFAWTEIKFSIALTTDVVANFKKPKSSTIQTGSTLVVHAGSRQSDYYIRNGDQVELLDTMRTESAIKATSSSLIITPGVCKREEKELAIQHARKPTRSR
ncbi:MAG: hypothetical protein ACFFDT_23325 [Candidatus Hodarchaeota archaeon]